MSRSVHPDHNTHSQHATAVHPTRSWRSGEPITRGGEFIFAGPEVLVPRQEPSAARGITLSTEGGEHL